MKGIGYNKNNQEKKLIKSNGKGRANCMVI
jgi:hypothetical protein